MRKLPVVATSVAASLGAALSATVATPFAAAVPTPDVINVGCVTHAEFRRIEDGMTKATVHRIFGTRGSRTSLGMAGVSKEYEPCDGDRTWSYVHVDYKQERSAYRVWFKWEYISS